VSKRSAQLRKQFEESLAETAAGHQQSIKGLCATHLAGRYELEVIDLYQHPELAKDEQIIAAPTLVKKLPPPLRKMIGNLSDVERVLVGLDVQPRSDTVS
jgi:circadian clock protein KaiB